MGQANRGATNIRPDAVGGRICGIFATVFECRLDVADNVVFGGTLDHFGLEVSVSFNYRKLISGQIIRLFGRPDTFNELVCSI